MKAISGCVVDSQDVYLSLFRRLSGCAKGPNAVVKVEDPKEKLTRHRGRYGK